MTQLFVKTGLQNFNKWKYIVYHNHQHYNKDYNEAYNKRVITTNIFLHIRHKHGYFEFFEFFSSMQENIGISKIGYIFHILTFFICYLIDSVTSFRYEWKSMQNNTIERCINIHGWHNIYISQWIKFNISWLFLFFDFWQHYNKKSMFRSLCCTHLNWINAEYLIIILHQSLLSISCL